MLMVMVQLICYKLCYQRGFANFMKAINSPNFSLPFPYLSFATGRRSYIAGNLVPDENSGQNSRIHTKHSEYNIDARLDVVF
jgi:hypothetical protein